MSCRCQYDLDLRALDCFLAEQVYRIKDEIEDTSIEYPSYYLVPFHAYDNGNLDWTAAFECESATAAMGIRTWKDPALKPEQAQAKLRGNAFRCIEVTPSLSDLICAH